MERMELGGQNNLAVPQHVLQWEGITFGIDMRTKFHHCKNSTFKKLGQDDFSGQIG
jgi:hypothetical protein